MERPDSFDMAWATTGLPQCGIYSMTSSARARSVGGTLTGATPATLAIQRETRTIPIIFASVSDPVASGIVAQLDRPSGNITGFADFEATLGGKWLALLSETAPGLKRAAIMFNPDTAPASAYMPTFEAAARSLKIVPIIAPVRSDGEIETAIIALGREPGGGLVVIGSRHCSRMSAIEGKPDGRRTRPGPPHLTQLRNKPSGRGDRYSAVQEELCGS
jgi:putative ABC transport system substrate-binding protein